MKRLLLIVPVMVILGLIGALVGHLFQQAVIGMLIGCLIPVAWLIMVYCFLKATGFGVSSFLKQ